MSSQNDWYKADEGRHKFTRCPGCSSDMLAIYGGKCRHCSKWVCNICRHDGCGRRLKDRQTVK